MDSGNNEAGKRISSSLPPVSPSLIPPLTTHFSRRPPTVTTQPSSLALSFPVSASPMLPSAPWTPSASSFRTRSPSSSSSLGDSLNQLPSPLNLHGKVSLTNSVGWKENASNRGSSKSQPPSSNWNLEDQVSSANSVGWKENASSRGPNTSQPPLLDLNLPDQELSSTNLIGSNKNASSLQLNNGPDTSNGVKQITAITMQKEIVSDPKRIKRILKSRVTAQRWKDKRSRYITELEERVKIFEKESASKSSKISILEREKRMLIIACKQLKIGDQTNEQETQIGLIEDLIAEIEMHDQSSEQ